MHISKNVSIKSCHIFKKNKNGHFIFGFFGIRSVQNGSNSQIRWTDISNSRIQARRAWFLVLYKIHFATYIVIDVKFMNVGSSNWLNVFYLQFFCWSYLASLYTYASYKQERANWVEIISGEAILFLCIDKSIGWNVLKPYFWLRKIKLKEFLVWSCFGALPCVAAWSRLSSQLSRLSAPHIGGWLHQIGATNNN